MWTKNQEMYIRANDGAVLCGAPALSACGLVWGSNLIAVKTKYPDLHRLRLGDLYLSYYHFDDDAFIEKIDDTLNVYKPTAERAVIDAIEFMEKSYDEGKVIESLQEYIRINNDNMSQLYLVADHYNVSRSKVDYWLNEAREEGDMSMG